MSTGRKALVPLTEYNSLIEMKKALKDTDNVITLYVDSHRAFRRQPGGRLLTFYEPTEAQEKLVQTIEDLNGRLKRRVERANELNDRIRDLQWKLETRDKALKQTQKALEKLHKEASKGPWKTFKNYVLGRD